jgi:hypothetical protein
MSVFSGGCIDAVGVGFADGVASGIATVIEELITSTAGNIGGE